MQPTVTNKNLIKATIIALVVAAIVLVTMILPAEYNIDPTGAGKAMGLTVLSGDAQNNSQSNSNAKSEKNDSTTNGSKNDIIEITVPAGRGVEFKFDMIQYDKMEYEWLTDGSALYFDLHGEPKGDTTGYFESYAIATLDKMKGSFSAPFDGSHGWYWKNNTEKDISIQLIVSGNYTITGLKQ